MLEPQKQWMNTFGLNLMQIIRLADEAEASKQTNADVIQSHEKR